MRYPLVMALLAIFIITSICYAKENSIFTETKNNVGIIIRTEIEKHNYKLSDELKLSIKLINNSKEDISIGITNGLISAKISVLNLKTKADVPMTEYGKKLYDPNRPIFMNKMKIINPSQEYLFNMSLNKIYDLSLPSDYEVTAEVFYFDINNKELSIKSLPLKFSIIEK